MELLHCKNIVIDECSMVRVRVRPFMSEISGYKSNEDMKNSLWTDLTNGDLF